MDKTTKLSVCLGFALAGWILPASMPLPKPLQGISLGFALTATIAGATESKRETVRQRFARTERDQEFEFLATESILRHEQRLRQLYEELGFGEDEYDRSDYDRYDQPQLDGTTIHQPTIVAGNGNGEQFNLDWLLSSNSHHALLCGDTGAGKTVLSRWLLGQLGIKDVSVLDPDDDGNTWQGYRSIGADDDWEGISKAYLDLLAEFNDRKPNDPNLSPKGIVLEELPDHLLEVKDSKKILGRLLRRGRKRKVFLLAITQSANPDEAGISAPLRKCFTCFFLQGYAFHALKHLVPREDKTRLSEGLKQCNRPALVQFKGQWFVWDVPDLSSAPTTAPSIAPSNGTIAPTTAPNTAPSIAPNTTPSNGTIASLNKCLAAPVATELHWKIVDFALGQGKPVSVREVMRGCGIKTAEECKTLLLSLQALELGELQREGDRILFSAYPPLN